MQYHQDICITYKRLSCNIIRIYVSHTNGTGFGNIALSFTINQSNLTAWKNKYGIS